ncbi:MAG: hypothetical protein FVQ85_05195 [Planctomycetes bacterium]|nr:hypothetical protein [Planctomycetota bacterium]
MSTSSITSSSKIQMDYMKLLVTQLQNQNPLEPLDNNDMASQLAQFSQLAQLETMNSSFAKVLENAKLNYATSLKSYATSLIGKKVSFVGETESGFKEIINAIVEKIYHDVDGSIVLSAGNYTLGLENVISVKN